MQSSGLLFIFLYTCTANRNSPNEHSRKYHLITSDLRTQCANIKGSDCTERFCWGYEEDCTDDDRVWVPECQYTTNLRPWAKSLDELRNLFWRQADFGYVKDVLDTLQTICAPNEENDSQLICSKNARFCKATNLYINFQQFHNFVSNDARDRFLENIFKKGDIGGKCKLDTSKLAEQGEHKSALQSWFAELENFTSLDFRPSSSKRCDLTERKPTVFMKLDAGVNLYHHFCDFFNLYASQHANGSFSDDTQIVMWDTTEWPYSDLFNEAWRAFSRHPLKRISDFAGKRVCFKDVVFPLLPRMRGGLYYNTFIVSGCEGSGLMKAFHYHFMSKMKVPQDPVNVDILRVTVLQRSTQWRKITNIDQLVKALKAEPQFTVKVVDYKYREMDFLQQLRTTYNSDIFIGMHGAGLAHVLFLPDWAALFEIYNTDDKRCYHDLARQRGVVYATWENMDLLYPEHKGVHPTLGTPHAKFTNYGFDVQEFMKIVRRLAAEVTQRKRNYQMKHSKEESNTEAHEEL